MDDNRTGSCKLYEKRSIDQVESSSLARIASDLCREILWSSSWAEVQAGKDTAGYGSQRRTKLARKIVRNFCFEAAAHEYEIESHPAISLHSKSCLVVVYMIAKEVLLYR